MRKYVTTREVETLSSALIREFTKFNEFSEMHCVDIEYFVTEFLGYSIVYESFAESDKGKIGFVSDGSRTLSVVRNGRIQEVLFSENEIVIEKARHMLWQFLFLPDHNHNHYLLKIHRLY